ncbi:MAG: hypothetical protein J0H68_08220 [Sphingobacteriia bacterium]|nr:hypothetical protein [Sphingobacteriia bacterium]
MRNLQILATSIVILATIIWYVITSTFALAHENTSKPFITIKLNNSLPDFEKVTLAVKKAKNIGDVKLKVIFRTSSKDSSEINLQSEETLKKLKSIFETNGFDKNHFSFSYNFNENVSKDEVVVFVHEANSCCDESCHDDSTTTAKRM